MGIRNGGQTLSEPVNEFRRIDSMHVSHVRLKLVYDALDRLHRFGNRCRSIAQRNVRAGREQISGIVIGKIDQMGKMASLSQGR